MYKISKYLIASLAIAVLFVAPFFCKAPGNEVHIESIDGQSNVQIHQSSGDDTNSNWIFLGNTVERDSTKRKEVTNATN